MKDDINGAAPTNNEYHDDISNVDSGDMQAIWRKDSEAQFKGLPSVGPSRWKLYVFVSLTITVLLALVITMGVNNGQTSGRLSAFEERLLAINDTFQSIMTMVKSTDNSRQHKMHQLEVSQENMQKQLDRVVEETKPVSDLQKKMSEFKCTLTRLLKNDSDCCPLGWDVFSDNCYFFSRGGRSWYSARDHCQSHGAQLLVLKSSAEKRFVIGRTMPNYYWLGLTDEHTGDWHWIDGTAYTVVRSEWRPGQPDDWHLHGLGGGEDCAHFHSDGRYNDDHCSRGYRYVCKGPLTDTLLPITE